MIEIISKDDEQRIIQDREEERVFLPKNIRQVGSPRGRHRIYLEDYVYTYLRSMAKNSEKCAAVFFGKSRVVKDIRYTFVNGVVGCAEAVFQWENIRLDESFWDYIYREQKEFFPEMEIVGWMLGTAGQAPALSPAVESAHRKYFAGRDKVLMLLDILEDEELFFVYEQGYLAKREGYYIYYEKNPAMQEYMIYKKEEELRLEKLRYSDLSRNSDGTEEDSGADTGSRAERDAGDIAGDAAIYSEIKGQEEANVQMQQRGGAQTTPREPKTQAEEALESYRRMLLERQELREERQSRRFLYTASSFFLVVLCVIGITTINNYRKMQEVEGVLNIMKRGEEIALTDMGEDRKNPSTSLADKDTDMAEADAASGEEKGLVVETVESQIKPLEEQKEQGTDASRGENGAEQNETGEKKDRGESDDAQKANPDDVQKADAEQHEDSGEEPGSVSDSGTQETSAAGQEPEKRYYVVQAGDTLNTICLSIYHSKDKVQELKEINGIEDGDKILVGQKLLLP